MEKVFERKRYNEVFRKKEHDKLTLKRDLLIKGEIYHKGFSFSKHHEELGFFHRFDYLKLNIVEEGNI